MRAGFLDRNCDDDCLAVSFLMGLTREEAHSREGYVMSHYFIHERPRFAFTAREQQLLCLSLRLQDPSDKRLAEALEVSVPAVKNWWQLIYERVAAVDADLLPLPDADRARGPEKRRRLMQYVRDHPEELRPYKLCGGKKGGASAG